MYRSRGRGRFRRHSFRRGRHRGRFKSHRGRGRMGNVRIGYRM
jgi:hypothetical protein